MDSILTSTMSVDIVSLIEQRKFAEAITLLKDFNGQSGVDHLSMLALSYFHSEQYELAVSTYEKALALMPSDAYLQEMLQHAKGNAIAQVHIPIPDVYYFEREKLLMKPVVPEGALPSTPVPPPPPATVIKKTQLFLGNILGEFSTVAMQALTIAWGRL